MYGNDLKIDTAKLEQFASKYESINNKVKDSFRGVQTSINSLKQTWSGNSATAAMAVFDQLRTDVCAPLETALLNVSLFLKNVVGGSYKYIEDANSKLADSFK